ncbi:HAD domain-containing protein, partial [Piscinibacter sp.]
MDDQSMRVIFLDFGGVTHPNATDNEARAVHRGSALGTVQLDAFCWFDILPGLLAGHDDVFVVVHSNWRFSHTPEEIGDLL